MSVFRSSSSTSRAIISKLAPPYILPFLYPIDLEQSLRPQIPLRNRLETPRPLIQGPAALEACFFNSLAAAGQCRKHNLKQPVPCTLSTSRRSNISTKWQQAKAATFKRQNHTSASPMEEDRVLKQPVLEPNRTKEELMALVDQYGGESFTDQLPLLEPPNLYQPSDGPYLTVSDKEQDDWPPPQHAWPASEVTMAKLNALGEALRDSSKDPEDIFLLYRDLPAPRVPYLEANTRHRLLRHLAIVERKDERSMLRYFSVVDDMKGAAIPLKVWEWTSALSFASRYVAKSTEVEVEAALHMWREMEHVAGVKSNDATFNVLFDVACKAGKFVLAEMIYKEMQTRGFEFNRYHHVSQIHYYGLKSDGDGARAAYKALVDKGEIVDTVVMNAMISALIRAHEANAAEYIYERMKKIHIETSGSVLPPKSYKARREINKVLMKLAKLAKSKPEMQQVFQRKSILAPDLHTFRILVNYFAIQAGELDKTTKFLDEMAWFEIPVHGALFLALLKGFALHGGIRYTHWTEARLENVWKALLQAIDDDAIDMYMSKWMVVWALRAFAKCSGQPRMVDVWEHIKEKWDPGEEEEDFVVSYALRPLLDGEDMSVKRFDWLLGSL
ncbi:pentatricopeptide repeat-containing [Hyphodiscus hymeniophilus]|uniref:Pentatricopeptide repeat-containing n=1 Tax=Hyphodiscus hymeniophilus TaxID=353542 RepID=A0A9P6VPM6_9HELO|nr:pentatricopeptide repeat-containing [Hyphodiscus hymeniophilus]